MAQLSLYMNENQMTSLRSDAEKEGVSISSYARQVLEQRHQSNRGWVNGWPPNYFNSIKPLEFNAPDELQLDPIEPLNA